MASSSFPRKPRYRKIVIEVDERTVCRLKEHERRLQSLEDKMESLFHRSDEVKRFLAYQQISKNLRELQGHEYRSLGYGTLEDASNVLKEDKKARRKKAG